jgi:small-conductance mechanosensitive channel
MKTIRAAIFFIAFLTWMPSHAATPAPANAGNAKPASQSGNGKPASPAAAPAAPAEDLPSVPAPQFPQAQSKLDGWKQTLDQIEAVLRARVIDDTVLNNLRNRAAAAQGEARDLISEITPPLEAATARAAELAPSPEANAPQPDDVKLERAKLLAEIAARQGIIQQGKLINVRAQQTIDAISDRRRAIFNNSVLQRSTSLANPTFWITAASAVPIAAGHLVELLSKWGRVLASQPLRAASGFLIAAVVVLGFFLSPGRRWWSRWTRRDPEIANPSPMRKTGSAAVIVLADTALTAVALLVLYQALMMLGVLPDDVSPVIRALFVGITFGFFFVRLTTAVLAPGRPTWRLIELDNAAADGMISFSVLLAIVIACGVVVDATNVAIGAPVELSIASQGVVAVVKALLYMGALRVAAATEADDETTAAPSAKRSAWRLLIPIGWVMATAAILAPFGGYVAFGRFVTIEMGVVITALMSFVLLSRFAAVLINTTFAFHGAIGRFLRQTAGLGSGAVRQIAALLGGLVQLTLVGLTAFFILTTWGIRSDDIVTSMSSAFFSFQIGNITISPSAILGAVAVLIIGVVATRALKRWLEERFLPETNLDVGVRSSIGTGAGYAGVILATLIALSYVGLNLQNVAIVAGALSVGIGFGLQSIINNFVSGLILLVERPIKVGDRIEVGSRMGVVKRINVRATEIATYDNLSVIVPNAELISGQVVNWMHGSYSARLSVTVGTSCDADPDKVIEILLDIVAHHPRALKSPEPFAILGNFGSDGLEFSVFFHVAHIGIDAGAANEVRLEILKRFRKEGIDFPNPQRDLHVRDLDRIEVLMRELAGPERSTASLRRKTPSQRS